MENIRVKDTLVYTIIKYMALGMGFLRELINANGLGPELLGVLGNLLLVLSYTLYCNLGIVYSMTKECSIINDQEKEKRDKIVSSTFTFVTLLSILFLIISIGCFVVPSEGNMNIYMGLIFIIAIFDQYRTFFTNYYRIEDDLKQINKMEVVYQFTSTIAIVLLLKYKVFGVLLGFVIGGACTFAISIKKRDAFKLKIDGRVLKQLIKVGLPLLLYNLGYYIFSTVDRIMIIKYLQPVDLGYYTFASQIAKATLLFITSVMFIYYPKALNKLNLKNNSNKQEIKDYIISFDGYIEVLGALLILVGSIIITPFTHLIMKEYVASINIYRILVMSVIANQLAYFISVFILSNGKEMVLVKLQGITIAIAFLLNYVFLKLGFGIEGIALATLITNIIYSIIQHGIFSNMLFNEINFKDIIKVYGRFMIFIFIMIFVGYAVTNFVAYIVINTMAYIILYFSQIKKIFKMVKVKM